MTQSEKKLQTLQLEMSYNLKRRPVKQSYCLQDVETLFEQLINDSLNCEALAAFQFLCKRYVMYKRIEKEACLQLIYIKNGSQKPGEQCLSINVITSVIFQTNNIKAEDILGDFNQSTSKESCFFKEMSNKFYDFLQNVGNTSTQTQLILAFNLEDSIGTVNIQQWKGQGELVETESLHKQIIHLNYQDSLHKTVEQLLKFGQNLRNVNWYDLRKYSQWVYTYIRQNNGENIFIQKEVFGKLLNIFQGYPAIISKVLRHISKDKSKLSNLLQVSWRQLFIFFNRILPCSKMQIIQSVLQTTEIILQNNRQYCQLVWQCHDLMNCLCSAIILPRENIKIRSFSIFKMLIINKNYPEISWRIEENKLAQLLLKSFLLNKREQLIPTKKVILEGLKAIYKIMEFEKGIVKFSKIQTAVFTENLRESGLGYILEQIYCRFDGYIKAITIAILGQSFVKIQGQISSISSIHNKVATQHSESMMC